MIAQENPNRHYVKGIRDFNGYYTVACPHNESFEYINGWGVRMVGSACCGACPFNAMHKRKTHYGEFDVICLHGPEKNERQASIIKTKV